MTTLQDPQIEEWAETLTERANIESGDYIYILCKSLEALPLFEEVRKKVIKKGGIPHEHLLYDSQVSSGGMDRDWMKYASETQLETVSKAKIKEMEEMDGYIRIDGIDNSSQLEEIDRSKISIRNEATQQIKNKRLNKEWVQTCFPTYSMAEENDMSLNQLEEFVHDAVNQTDWNEIKEKNMKIKQRFDRANRVRIKDQNTELSFCIKDREGVSSHGKRNIPDGEVFYAPRKKSVEGYIRFSHPGVMDGNEARGIELEFENGRVVSHSAETGQDFLEAMLNTDESARYIGEFGIGTNRQISKYIKKIVFAEKMGGTIHLALGRAYEETVPEDEERNQSGIHWDIIKDLREREGGGKIILDGEVVQEDGEWKILD